ncbi:MAG: DEAD/DEAH box helicase [Bacteriovoracia bacterium]
MGPKTTSFNELSLPQALSKALAAMNFKTPTPIQVQAVPVALEKKDIIGCAQTGTGKTAAFCIPTITNLLSAQGKTALILAPTRELAVQIEETLRKLLKYIPEIRLACLIGGAAMFPQIRSLRKKPRIIVATPGRLTDHIRQRNISLSNCEVLILDEADRMLDMGFAPQLNEILRFVPKARQTLLFSATISPEIQKLASKYLKNPTRITIGEASRPVEKIVQSTLPARQDEKNDILMKELDTRQGSVLVFARTKRRTDRVARILFENGFKVSRIHGDRTQRQRLDAIEGFRKGRFRILVATDIAARGIDISHIAHVINYDLPMLPEDYVHRIGRTARAGAGGQALSLIAPEEKRLWKDISRFLARSARGPERSQGLTARIDS